MTEQQKANVKAWIAALRSDKYRQGWGSLCRDKSFCCLGVLADINNIPTIKINSLLIVYYTVFLVMRTIV